jgi:glutamate-1-semialdehyde 2,1-aminomutase
VGDDARERTELVDEYTARTARSRSLHEELCRTMPAGQTRTLVYFEPHPVALIEGEGPVVRDVDGNEYIDVVNNYTALVHGHRHPSITEAARGVLGCGTVFPAPHASQLDLSSQLQERLPAADLVRFTNSGSEATLLALRIARAATGRSTVVGFEGGYHGSVREFAEGGRDVRRVPYNDVAAVDQAIDSSVAAVFVEPFLASGGVVPAARAFLEHLREQCSGVGALLVVDEVQSLRNAFNGAHGMLGLQPDLVLLGKIIGGGFPVGAVVGRADLMELTDPRNPRAIAHSGTFNGNVMTMTAGAVSLRLLDASAIDRLNSAASGLAQDIEAAGRRAGVPAVVSQAGSILQVHPTGRYPETAANPDERDRRVLAALHLALLLEGVYAAPRGMLNLSTAMTDDHLSAIGSAYERAFARVKDLATIYAAV